ncbi:hypothetical protein C4J92_0506 [Pseudomonas sp. R3-18-08]|nr:hypothetical protein C4J92_0506 [Pseudomonas sp. R3-18-08]
MMRCNRVQPFLFKKFSTVDRKKSGLLPNRRFGGAFHSEIECSCSEKEQKTGVCPEIRVGATYSRETGCTLFALLNSIRAPRCNHFHSRFIGWRLSWGNVSHKCAAGSIVYPVNTGSGLTDRRYIKTKPGRHFYER